MSNLKSKMLNLVDISRYLDDILTIANPENLEKYISDIHTWQKCS